MLHETALSDIEELFIIQIEDIIKSRNWPKLKQIIKKLHTQDLATILSNLGDDYNFIFFRNVPRDLAADLFSYLEVPDQQKLLTKFTDSQTKAILSELSPDDRTALFEELPGEITGKLLNMLSPDDLKEARALLGYPDDSVGRIMTPDYISVTKDMTVKKAIEHIRKFGKDTETINIIYVVDEEKKLIGEFRIRNLLLADTQKTINNIMSDTMVTLKAFDDQEKAVSILQTYDKVAIPVVDSKGIIVGIVTFDDIMDIAEEEATEDIQRSSSVSPLQINYTQASIGRLYIKRIGWLMMLLTAGFFSSKIISLYENVISARIALSFFIPVLLGSGGNTGAQSTTLIIRAIATGDINISEWFKVFAKEIFLGLLLGTTLGLFSLLIAHLVGSDLQIGLVVGTSMLFLIVWANIIGAMLPILITHLKFDPAIISNPLISTIVDISGLFIYFSIGIYLLG